MTIYLYLNDVEEGGGTHFHDVDQTVMPKRGRALLWPSVKDDDPNLKDPRTHHSAMPVIKGVKYGANVWVRRLLGLCHRFATIVADILWSCVASSSRLQEHIRQELHLNGGELSHHFLLNSVSLHRLIVCVFS